MNVSSQLPCDRFARRGFTMVEMLLVLGVIVVFAGMTVPPVMRMFSQQKLTGSAERVRAAIAGARFRAIESGLIYQFCSETNGSRFVVVPFEPDHANAQSGGQKSSGGRAWGQLPKGVVFSSATVRTLSNPATTGTSSGSAAPMATASHKLPAGALDGLPNASDLASANWGLPILFHPEGSANADVEITVSDTKAQHIKLHVRAFTGAVSLERLVSGKR